METFYREELVGLSVRFLVSENLSLLKYSRIDHVVQLASTFIKFPVTASETTLATTSFQEFTDCAIPQVVGAVDDMHIESLAPSSESKLDYFSRKQ